MALKKDRIPFENGLKEGLQKSENSGRPCVVEAQLLLAEDLLQFSACLLWASLDGLLLKAIDAPTTPLTKILHLPIKKAISL